MRRGLFEVTLREAKKSIARPRDFSSPAGPSNSLIRNRWDSKVGVNWSLTSLISNQTGRSLHKLVARNLLL
jgi:hypothetical protein